MKIEIGGCETVTDLILKARAAEKVLNRNPNTVILSTELADTLVFEMDGNIFEQGPRWKRAIGAMMFDLNVFVVSNKGHDYIEVMEIEK